MRPIRETIPLDEAIARCCARPASRSTEPSASRSARPADAFSPRRRFRAVDVPPFDRAAMDGYAVIAEDTFGAGRYDPKVLRCIENVYTGAARRRDAVAPASASRSRPARRMPEGADAVVMVEETEKADEQTRSASSRRSIRGSTSAGARADIAAGQSVLARGRSCSTRAASARSPRSASTDVDVSTRARASRILSTGNEIVEPGQPLGPRTDLRHQPASRCQRSSQDTAACRSSYRLLPTTSRDLAEAVVEAAAERLRSSSRAEVRSASAT